MMHIVLILENFRVPKLYYMIEADFKQTAEGI